MSRQRLLKLLTDRLNGRGIYSFEMQRAFECIWPTMLHYLRTNYGCRPADLGKTKKLVYIREGITRYTNIAVVPMEKQAKPVDAVIIDHRLAPIMVPAEFVEYESDVDMNEPIIVHAPISCRLRSSNR